uniref:hypothetical protein n=1 Tax=Bacteroides faecis TaxID=674529 RepID=UPI003BAB6BCB
MYRWIFRKRNSRHERLATIGSLADVDTELTSLLTTEQITWDDKDLTASILFSPVLQVISETKY